MREKTSELITKVAELNMEQKEHILSTSVVCFNKCKRSNEEIYTNVGMLEDTLSKRMEASLVYFERKWREDLPERSEALRFDDKLICVIQNKFGE